MEPSRIQRIFERSYFTRIALNDERTIGGGYTISDGELDATVHGLAVLPEFQHRGVGIQIMQSLLCELEGLSILLTTVPEYRKLLPPVRLSAA